jgi:hypothetical protein
VLPLISIVSPELSKVLSKPVRIQNNIPAGCDPSTSAAASTWNSASKFQISGVAQNYTSASATDTTATDPSYIDIRGSSNLSSTNPMYAISLSMTSVGRTDSDIFVNTNMLYYLNPGEVNNATDFYCGTTLLSGGIGSQTDYQTAILHEFGHVLGFNHRTDGATGPCVMAASVARGVVKRTPCTDERQRLVTTYGAK